MKNKLHYCGGLVIREFVTDNDEPTYVISPFIDEDEELIVLTGDDAKELDTLFDKLSAKFRESKD